MNISKNSSKRTTLREESEYREGFSMPDQYKSMFPSGLNKKVIKRISAMKDEPAWMLDFRLRAYEIFKKKSMPKWGGDLSKINFDDLVYYAARNDGVKNSWRDVPEEVKETFERLGIPKAEREYLAGVEAQYDSEVIYGSLIKELEEKGVIFLSTDDALKRYPRLFKDYFATVVPPADNKFAALNSAVWSGGSFIYVPKGVKVERPLQAYFRINAAKMGQFERTLIIIEDGASASYVEGCSAPIYSSSSLHSAVVEVIVKRKARFRYTTIQNWYDTVYNLVTKRAFVYRDATMEWVDGNIGSKLTMKYPSVYLMEDGAKGELLSLAVAGNGQHQDSGGKMVHLAPNTSSRIISKSISKDGGRTSYRGLIKVIKRAKNVKSSVVCDALLLDKESRSDTYPLMKVESATANIGHEASVSKVQDDQLFYLMSRGMSEDEATALIVNGFIEPVVKELPMEYAMELNRLIELEMEGSVG